MPVLLCDTGGYSSGAGEYMYGRAGYELGFMVEISTRRADF